MIDHKDEEILRYLLSRPEATVKEVAEELRIPRPTAQRRILNLRIAKHMKAVMAVNPASLGFALRYRIDVSVSTSSIREQMSMKELAQHIMKMPAQDPRFRDRLIVENIHILLGGKADLSVHLRAKHHTVIVDFVTDALRRIRGVEDTSIIQQGWSAVEQFLA